MIFVSHCDYRKIILLRRPRSQTGNVWSHLHLHHIQVETGSSTTNSMFTIAVGYSWLMVWKWSLKTRNWSRIGRFLVLVAGCWVWVEHTGKHKQCCLHTSCTYLIHVDLSCEFVSQCAINPYMPCTWKNTSISSGWVSTYTSTTHVPMSKAYATGHPEVHINTQHFHASQDLSPFSFPNTHFGVL